MSEATTSVAATSIWLNGEGLVAFDQGDLVLYGIGATLYIELVEHCRFRAQSR